MKKKHSPATNAKPQKEVITKEKSQPKTYGTEAPVEDPKTPQQPDHLEVEDP